MGKTGCRINIEPDPRRFRIGGEPIPYKLESEVSAIGKGAQLSEIRSRRSEVRGMTTEDRGSRIDDCGLKKSEVRSQRSEGWRLRIEDRGLMIEEWQWAGSRLWPHFLASTTFSKLQSNDER